MSNRACRALAAFLALAIGNSAIAAAPFTILYHEAIVMQKSVQVGARERIAFDAYGRRFELLLEPNVRMQRALASRTARIQPLQGSVVGAPRSWVRLSRSETGWRGMFSDGQDIYAIEPASDVADFVTQPLAQSGAAPVVYRLADALMPQASGFCEIEPAPADAPPTALTAFKALASDLRIQAARREWKQIRVGVVADYEFTDSFRQQQLTPEDAIVARMNIVDGIFFEQLGVRIDLAPPTLFSTPNDPFTKSRATDLLEELRRYRRGSPEQLALGLTHLMTGRNINGETVGIAYLGTVCNGEGAASLSEATRSTTTAALITAHEIGHNFSAPHDGDSGGACASTPQTYLMAPRINGNDTFSACSIAQIAPVVASRSCLSDYWPPDAALEISSPSVQALVNRPFTASFSVRAAGDDTSADVNAAVSLPTGIQMQSATVAGGTCSGGDGAIACTIGALAPGESRQVDLGLLGADPGVYATNLSLTSTNDSVADNNTATLTITVSAAPLPVLPPSSTSSGSGAARRSGGGTLDLWLLAALSAALWARLRKLA